VNPRFLLEGVLLKTNKNYRLTLSLFNSSTNECLWSAKESFDIHSGDIIAIQEDLARQVAQKLAGMNGIIGQYLYSETKWEDSASPRAYATFMHFYRYHKDPSEANANRLLPKVTELVALEPGFAPDGLY
jgi:hypothetical protein